MPSTGWNFIGSGFYQHSGGVPGPVSDSAWTDLGFGALLSPYAAYPLVASVGLPLYAQGSIPTWNSSTPYVAGNVVWILAGTVNFFICTLANTGANPNAGPPYWASALPPGMNFQWSSTSGTLTPIAGSPSFFVPFSTDYWDETGVSHATLLGFIPPALTGAVALFAEVPTGLVSGFAGYPWMTSAYVPAGLYYYYTPNPDIEVEEDLYSCNGVFDQSAARGDVLKSLIGSMAGTVIPPGELWHMFAGAYNPPTAVLTDADLRDSIKGDFRVSRRDICNGVKGTFIPSYLPTNQTQAQPAAWRWTDFPPYQGNGLLGHPNYIAEDGGAIIWKEARFGFTTSIWAVQRLAKIILQLLRFQISLHLPCKLTAFPIQAGDTITFIHARWAALASPPPTTFFVTQSTIVVENVDGVPVLAVDLVLRQHDPAIYEFTAPSTPTNQGEYSAYGSLGTM